MQFAIHKWNCILLPFLSSLLLFKTILLYRSNSHLPLATGKRRSPFGTSSVALKTKGCSACGALPPAVHARNSRTNDNTTNTVHKLRPRSILLQTAAKVQYTFSRPHVQKSRRAVKKIASLILSRVTWTGEMARLYARTWLLIVVAVIFIINILFVRTLTCTCDCPVDSSPLDRQPRAFEDNAKR